LWSQGVSVWSYCWPLIIAAILSLVARKYVFETVLQNPPPAGAAVLITGCSSGFGKGFAQRLTQQGLVVYASVRKAEDGDRIRDELPREIRSRLIPVIMDVTRQDQIDSARDLITNQVGDRGLFAVVNNAGIQAVGPVETISLASTQRVFDTNVFGALAVTRAFLPLLRTYSKSGNRSHLVFISSGVGIFAPPLMTTYAATKHAVEAFCDGLRIEVRPFGVHVSSIEPGSYMSEIIKQMKAPSSESKQDNAPPSNPADPLYQARFDRFLATLNNGFNHLPQPTPVFQTLESILYAKFPPSRALVGVDASALAPLTTLVPDTLLDGLFRSVETLGGLVSGNKKQY